MTYLFITSYDNKIVFMSDDNNEIRPVKLGSSEPKLVAISHDKPVILTQSKLGKDVFDNLYMFVQGSCEFYTPCFSFKKGEEDNLAFQLSFAKYAFAYIDGTFKYYDRHAETWRKVRYFFENKEQELAFKALAQKGSFVLGLDKLSIEDFFNANDVLNNLI